MKCPYCGQCTPLRLPGVTSWLLAYRTPCEHCHNVCTLPLSLRLSALVVGFITGIVVAAAGMFLVFAFISHMSIAVLLTLCMLVVLVWGRVLPRFHGHFQMSREECHGKAKKVQCGVQA